MSSMDAPLWKRERLGLSLIGASLVAITILCGFLYQFSSEQQRQHLRMQGVELRRVLSAMPLTELAPSSNPSSILRTLNIGDTSSAFAYASLIRPDGTTITESTAPGVVVPRWQPPDAPSAWLGERTINDAPSKHDILEFYAPILTAGEHSGHLRLGYFVQGAGLSTATLPTYATVALVVFLLTPFFYLLVRRETQPLRAAASDLQSALDTGAMASVKIDASGELGQFMGKFNQFVDFANQRIAAIENDRERVITSTKLLSYRKERVLRVLESLPEAVLVMDDSGTITVVNQRLESLLGVDVSDLAGNDSLDWCTQPTVRQFLSQCRHRATRRYLPEAVEFKLDEQREQSHTITAYPIFSSSDHKTNGCVVVIRDTTLQALARAGRAQFVAHVAHELKTPLNVLSMYSQSLQRAEEDDHETRVEAANVIEDEVQRLSALINNLLSLTKIEMGSMDLDRHRVRISDLLHNAFDNAQHVRGADQLEFSLDIAKTVGVLNLDKDLLRIALNNLLSNAIKYNRPGGTVTLHASEDVETLTIKVSDTGIGISKEDQARVFDKFYRSEARDVRDVSGHGLGLALAHDIVELHNGALTVESTPGEGTTFTITLYRQMHEVREVG